MFFVRKIICFLILLGLTFFDCIAFFSNNVMIFYTKPAPVIVPLEINITDWKLLILKMLRDVSFFDNIDSSSVLLVNLIKDNTNGNIQINKITDLLIKCILENTNKYRIMCIEQLYFAYRELGLFPENHINSYNFSINIANYLHADYVLYSIAYGDVMHPMLELQLILVNTGEILTTINASMYN